MLTFLRVSIVQLTRAVVLSFAEEQQGLSWGHLGASWNCPGAILGPLEAILGPTWAPGGPSVVPKTSCSSEEGQESPEGLFQNPKGQSPDEIHECMRGRELALPLACVVALRGPGLACKSY